MMYSRLTLSRNILSDEGVIFISIDDNEVANMRKICDEIFGETNFVAQINWKGRGGGQDSKYYAVIHEFILVYAKNINNFVAGEEIKSGDVYPFYDEKKKRYYKTQLLRKWGSNSRRIDRPNLFYSIPAPDGTDVFPMLTASEEGRWRWGKDKMDAALNADCIEFSKKGNEWIAYEKIYAPLEGEEKTRKYVTWIDDISNGTSDIKDLFGKIVFDYAKSPELMAKFVKMAKVEENDIVLDFFSGSATTAHAVLQLNAKDNGHRRFIMVQLAEKCEENTEAYSAGYSTIPEIGKERIRRAGKKITDESPLTTQNLDIGFRVLKLADSNMNDVYYSAGDYGQQMLDDMESKIKPDRTDLDLLFGCLLEWGLPLSLPYKSETIDGCTVHTYAPGDPDLEIRDALIACFNKDVPTSVIEAIARRNPLRAVFREECFTSSPDKINVFETFKRLAQGTAVKVI